MTSFCMNDGQRPRRFCQPFGTLSILPSILGLIACSFCIVAVTSCNFMEWDDNDGGIIFGFITIEGSSFAGCAVYSGRTRRYFYDGAWWSGLVFGILAGYGGFVVWALQVYLLVLSCTRIEEVRLWRKIIKILSALYVLFGICSILMLVVLASNICTVDEDEHCYLLFGGKMAIVACPLYFATAVSTWMLLRVDTLTAQTTVCCPYGTLRTALPATLVGIASCFAIVAVTHCNFLKVLYYDTYYRFGFVTHDENEDGCVYWHHSDKEYSWDGYWRSSMAFGIIAGYGGLLAFGFSIAISCMRLSASVLLLFKKILATAYGFLAICSGLMLLGFKSQFCEDSYWPQSDGFQGANCELSTGSILAILSSILYIGAGWATQTINETAGAAQSPHSKTAQATATE